MAEVPFEAECPSANMRLSEQAGAEASRGPWCKCPHVPSPPSGERSRGGDCIRSPAPRHPCRALPHGSLGPALFPGLWPWGGVTSNPHPEPR